jgi:hypothetical protein
LTVVEHDDTNIASVVSVNDSSWLLDNYVDFIKKM